MERQTVGSSHIASIGYDTGSEILEIEFLSGSVYQYSNVPGSVFDAIMAAPSKGQFFHYEIRDQYPYTRV